MPDLPSVKLILEVELEFFNSRIVTRTIEKQKQQGLNQNYLSNEPRVVSERTR